MHINEEKTLEKYGYESTDLKCSSKKPIIAICMLCNEDFIVAYTNCRSGTQFCNVCGVRCNIEDLYDFTGEFNNEYHAAPDENIIITDARNVLDELIMLCYNNTGFYPKAKFIRTNNPKLHYKCIRYFESYTEATRVADKYLEDINLNLNFVIDNVYKFNENAREYYKNNTEKALKRQKKWQDANPEKMRKIREKHEAKRKGWEKPIALNSWFEHSHLHHLHLIDNETGEYDHQSGIYIPEKLHRSISHSWYNTEQMNKINQKAFEFLATCEVI